jgi:hypothetical protein
MRRTAWLIAGALGVILVAGGAVALAGGGSRQKARYKLGSDRPHHGTSEHFVFDYRNPDDPGAKPPAVRRVVTILPRHAHYDTSVPGSCTASDAELMAQGAGACPERSAIGGGVVTVDTGAPGPGRIVTADVEFFNNDKDPDSEFIYLNTVRGSQARTVIRADVTRRRTITLAGMLPGTPPDGGAIDTVDLRVAAVHTKSGDYITTPRRCPDRGFWRTRVRFSYADGVTQTVRDRSRCEA